MAKVLVLYYSFYGHIEAMAEAVAEGARTVSGAEVVIKRVPETIPEDVLKLRKENLVDAKLVRVRVRQQFQAAFREGYKVLGFSDEVGYVLVKGAI